MTGERKAFSARIVCTEKFYAMSTAAQLLYFIYGMYGKSKGILIGARSIARACVDSIEPLYELEANGYLKPLDDGCYLIVDWYENNGIGDTAKKRLSYEYRKFRSEIIERDGGKCQLCGATENLEVHHIKSFAEFPELRLEPSNAVTWCKRCHRRYHGLEKK